MIICYTAWDMACDICNFYYYFWAIFLPFYAPKSQKIQISKKNTWRYHHCTHAYQKLWLDDVMFLRYCGRQMDGQMDGQKKWHIEVCAPPKNISIINIQPQHNKDQFSKRKEINFFRYTIILQIHNYLISLPAKPET